MAAAQRKFAPMASFRHLAPYLLLVLLPIAACERPAPAPPPDSVAPLPTLPPESATAQADSRGWDAALGSALLVAAEASDSALVVLPYFGDSALAEAPPLDVTALRGMRIELFARAGIAGLATVSPASDTLYLAGDGLSCTAWPTVRLTGAPTSAGWTVGLAAGLAQAIPMDSVDGLAGADSARLVAEVARLASRLPDDTVAAFRGLPFAVRVVRRFAPAPGVEALVAEVTRRINQEANPRMEHILLVAERDSGQTTGRYAAAYSERTAGTEETVESSDILAALLLGSAGRPTIVLRREYTEGSAYTFLERTGPKRWRVRWTSAYTGC
jgi:hypothetical protein